MVLLPETLNLPALKAFLDVLQRVKKNPANRNAACSINLRVGGRPLRLAI
jgi:hypothetical protein